MKTAILAFLVSFSSFASECFIRNSNLAVKEVSLAKEVCITGIELKLQVFGTSEALISYTLDGKEVSKTVRLNSPNYHSQNTVSFFVNSIESSFSGGGCGHTIEADSLAVLVMDKDGGNAHIESIEANVSKSNDNCHSPFRVIQTLSYEAI